jgi:RimJ/RimL family protein N-acetyltransferase
MISLPFPYPDREAKRYVEQGQMDREADRAYVFSIRLKEDYSFAGVIELRAIEREHSQGELSFWLAKKVWGKGYMSEAVEAAVGFGFEELGLNRLYAHHMLRNPATGRVLENCGFKREGLLRQRVIKWGKYEDVALCAILKQDWESRS